MNLSAGSPGTRIVSLGHYQPARVVTNDELSKRVDTNDEWIRDRVGIASRRIAEPTETLTDLAVAAGGKALAASGLAPEEIDLVIVASCSELLPLPNTATRVAARMGLPTPAAFDLNTACSGFSYALANAHHAILAGASRNALVIGVEKLSDWTDWDDRSTCILFADGACAVVVSPSDTPAIGPVVWGSDGEKGHAIRVETRDGKIKQEGQMVFRWATTALTPIALEACRLAGIEPAELRAFVPHQANLRIIEAIARKLGAEHAVVARDIVESGNTSAASIPLALSKMVERGEVSSGAPVLLLGFGGGLTYSGQVILCP
jgi:3-oxoacyl-[acyl-carrier-protein] synthase-3